jgi:chitinase
MEKVMSMKRNKLSMSLALLLASGPGLVMAQTTEGASGAQPLSSAVNAARAPGMPIGVTVGEVTPTTVELSWTAPTAGDEVAQYRVYTSSIDFRNTGSTATVYTVTGLTPGRTYNLQLTAMDADGGESSKTSRVPVTMPSDTEAPGEPPNAGVKDITANSITLTWDAASDNVGVTGYDLLRNTIRQDEVGATIREYTFTGLAANTTYTLGARARDAANNTSPIASIEATTSGGGPGDTTPPSAPTDLASPSKTSTSIDLTWTASIDEEGGSGVKEYIVSQGGTPLPPVTGTTRTVADLQPETQYTFTVKARDNAGNESLPSDPIMVTTDASDGGTAPSQPTNLTATPDADTMDNVVLTWSESSDADGDLAFYDVYSNGNLVTSVAAGTLTATIQDLRQNATYEFVARARDAAGNVSAECTDLTATCRPVRTRLAPRTDASRVFAPHYPTHLRSSALRPDSVKLEWDGAVSDVAVAYDVYQNGAKIGETNAETKEYTVSSLSPATQYVFTVAARNTATNTLAAKAPPITVATPAGACAAVPQAPTGISKTAGNSASITLSWTAPANSDNCTELRYEVYRDGDPAGEAPVVAFTDTGLAPSTSYSYTVRAINELGASTEGGPASLDTGDQASDPPPRNVGYFEQWGVYDRQYYVKNVLDSGTADVLTDIQYSFGNVQPKPGGGYVCQAGIFLPTDEDLGTGGDVVGDYLHVYNNEPGTFYPTIGVVDQTGQPLRGSWNQLRQLKAMKPHLKMLISLGGWTWTRNFSEAARPEHREAFVASCIDVYIKGNLPVYQGESWEGGSAGGPNAAAGLFDGIDIDWEYPVVCGLHCDGRPEDRENFTALLAEFRKQLDEAEGIVGRELSLSVAVGAGVDKIRATEVDKYHQYLDFISLMTYDFHGGWENSTNHQSALFPSDDDPSIGDVAQYNVDGAVQEFLNHGVPASKLLVGVPYYGRGWHGVAEGSNNGLYQAALGPISGPDAPYQDGITDYKVLKGLLNGADWTKHEDPEAGAAWIFNPNRTPSPGHFWTYEGPEEVAAKVNYAKTRGLGGVIIWALSGDTPEGELSKAIDDAWKASRAK